MRMAVLFLTMVSLGGAACRVSGDEPETPRGVLIPVPEDVEIDDAALQRLAEKYGDEKQGFLRLLLALEANQVDYSRDSLSDIKQKKAAVLQAAGQANAVVASQFSHPDLEIDYVRHCWEVVPRLEPNIVKVGPQEKYTTLKQALPNLRAGDQVELGAGSFVLPLDSNWVPPTDIAIVGKNQTSTTLKTEGEASQLAVERWRFRDLKIDLGGANRPSRNALPGGSLCVERCTVTGYSMPYGAFARGKRILIEDCSFDGNANRMGGRMFGMSSEWEAIYLRNTTIEEPRTMSYGMPCALVIDRCQFKSPQPVFLHGNPIFIRASAGLQQLPNQMEFEFATDDEAVVEFALGKRKEVDPRIHRLADAIKLSRNSFYWIGLLRHHSQEIRVAAAGQIQRLLGQQIDPKLLAPPAKPQPGVGAADEAIAAAIRDLKSDEYATREEARKKLILIGDPAVDALQEIAKRGSLEQKRSAEVILLKITGPPAPQPLPRDWDLEYGRISRWYEQNRSRLAWNEVAGSYQ
ncbi:MAG: hypothetical protein O3C40_18235 [Planctomycetota bacterium]|nr:hypothetical protein [Planctomycetota bacterium]